MLESGESYDIIINVSHGFSISYFMQCFGGEKSTWINPYCSLASFQYKKEINKWIQKHSGAEYFEKSTDGTFVVNDVENCHTTVKECNFLKLGGGIIHREKQNRLLKLHCNDTLTYWKKDKFFSGLINLTSNT